MRRELLNSYLFNSLAEVRVLSEEWRRDYNADRPHKSLKYQSPSEFLKKYKTALSTPASETLNQIEAMPVVDKAAVHEEEIKFENSK